MSGSDKGAIRAGAPIPSPDRSALSLHVDAVAKVLLAESRRVYGDHLVTVALFGSAGRATIRPDSDVDVLLVVDELPRGRIARGEQFGPVRDALDRELARIRLEAGCTWYVSAIYKTPAEVEFGSPLFLDMTEDARILYDRDDFFARRLERLRRRLAELGSKRIWRGTDWYWDLKPDYKPGEIFEI